MIHNLSLKYNATVTVSLYIESSLKGHSAQSSGFSDVTAHCRARGYSILGFRSRRSGKPVKLMVQPNSLHHKGGEMYYMLPNDLMEYSYEIFGDGVTVDFFANDTLWFRFPVENFKKVPVVMEGEIRCREQYTPMSAMVFEPDSILVYGDPIHIESVNEVKTERLFRTDVCSSIHGTTSLRKIQGLRFSETQVGYSMTVTRFVEVPTEVKVSTRNVPEGRTLGVYPSSVTVLVRCPFPMTSDLTRGIRVYVDYRDYVQSLSGKVQCKVVNVPSGVISCSLPVEYVSCSLE
ncbi:MAG: hypothetical protein HUJ94_03430 [Bacteroidales bacterium]|nr:hypothetical protein [Bacteroidales bacterium]